MGLGGYCEVADGHPYHGPYHDHEYGFPLTDESELFGRLMLEVNQAGLSWLTILKKQKNVPCGLPRLECGSHCRIR